MSSTTRVGTALAVLTVHNLAQNSVFNERGYVTANLVVSTGLIALGRDAGLQFEDMGLTHGDPMRTLQVSLATALAGATIVAMSHLPATRPYMRDERAPTGTPGEVARRALTRYPLGTALFEEVAFRGVLPALLHRSGWKRSDAMSAVLFGLWHLLPTHHALRVNRLAENGRRRAAGVLLGAAAAGLAGYALARLREHTGSLAGPWITHSALNMSAYLASVIARSHPA